MSLNPNQFRLFWGASDLKDAIGVSFDRKPSESMDDMWDRKLDESKATESVVHGAGVHDLLSTHGYNTKFQIPLYHGRAPGSLETGLRVGDGHHRIAAAADIERSTGKDVWIPVDNRDVF